MTNLNSEFRIQSSEMRLRLKLNSLTQDTSPVVHKVALPAREGDKSGSR